MKKSLNITLTLFFVMSFAGSAFAADNPFDDVPKNHWAYDAVSKLAKDGLITGDNGSFKGDQTITRYEMAVIVAKALAKSQGAAEQDKALIDKLSKEFNGELKTLGAKVTMIEAMQNRWSAHGDATLKYQRNSTHDPNVIPSGGKQNIDMNFDFLLVTQYRGGGGWSVVHEAHFNRDIMYPMARADNVISSNQTGLTGLCEKLFVNGPVGKTDVTFGVYNFKGAYGLLYDNATAQNNSQGLAGLQLAVGDTNTVKASVSVGKIAHNLGLYNHTQWGQLLDSSQGKIDTSKFDAEKMTLYSTSGDDLSYYAVNIEASLSKDTHVKAAYQYVALGSSNSEHYLEAGVDTKLTKDFTVMAVAGESSFSHQNKAYLVGLNYKGADKNSKVGDYGAFVNYIKSEANATIDGGYDIQDKVNGAKGWEIGYSFVPDTKMLFTMKYMDVKGTANASFNDKVFRTQLEFFF